MCDFFAPSDLIHYEARQRSIRINGATTSIRLENLMWEVLSDMARQQRCTTNELITRLHELLPKVDHSSPSFTSFLRVTCVRHLRETLQGRLAATEEDAARQASNASSARH